MVVIIVIIIAGNIKISTVEVYIIIIINVVDRVCFSFKIIRQSFNLTFSVSKKKCYKIIKIIKNFLKKLPPQLISSTTIIVCCDIITIAILQIVRILQVFFV